MIKEKKAVSEIIGYVLLIVIALSISVIVYSWIKFQIPKEKPECPGDITVVIKEYRCDSFGKIVNITFQNKGLFDVEGAYIKIANETGKIPIFELEPANIMQGIREKGFIYFFPDNPDKNLETGDSAYSKESIEFTYLEYTQLKKVSITPFVIKNNKIVLCPASEVKEEVNCN